VKKQKTIESLESEIDILNRKVTTFASQNAKQRQLAQSGESYDLISLLKEKNEVLASKLDGKDNEICNHKKRIVELEASLMKASVETSTARQKIAALAVAGEHEHHARRAIEILSQISAIWSEMGLALDCEQNVVISIENCLEDACERQLNEARMKKDSMIVSITEAKEKVWRMQKSLGLEITCPPMFTTLKLEKDFFDDLVQSILPKFEAASTQSKNIISAAKNIQVSLGLADSDLPRNLSRLLKNEDDSTSENDLSESFLSICETELSEIRVLKSEILIQNHTRQGEIAEALDQMNVSEAQADEFFSNSFTNHLGDLPEWWTDSIAQEVRQIIIRKATKVRADKIYSMHLESIHKAVLGEASLYRLLSERLQSLIERSQQILLKTVDGGHDAVEACASFRDALLRLPKLSRERIETCLSQIQELIPGVEAMIQSEIEALTVVWEALGTPTTDRGIFWESVDEHLDTSKPSLSDDIIQPGTINVGWISRIAKQGQRDYMNLDKKLSKLEAVHREVENLRARQDAKSKVLSLDSEVRLLNAQLSEFEEKKCSKDRLLSRQTASSHLLREERYRKQMKAKFTSKLEQLNELLKVWNEENSKDFDSSILSEDVRMLLQNNSWINERKEFMHLRTTKAKRVGKRRIDRVDNSESHDPNHPQEKRGNKATPSKITRSIPVKSISSTVKNSPMMSAASRTKSIVSGSVKRKAGKTVHSSPSLKKRKISPVSNEAEAKADGSENKVFSRVLSPHQENASKGVQTKLQKSGRRMALPPFGHVLEETETPRSKPGAAKH
jgi:hypothetical protein